MLPHRILFDEDTIHRRVQELAADIARDLPDPAPLLLGVLTGSFVFLADLARELARHGVEPTIRFIQMSHYGPGTEADRPVSVASADLPAVHGKIVLVVDDIFDSGKTLSHLWDVLTAQDPAWLKLCTFLDKPSRHQVLLKPDYVGMVVPDVWLIGYGLDLNDIGRALPYIGAVEVERVTEQEHQKP